MVPGTQRPCLLHNLHLSPISATPHQTASQGTFIPVSVLQKLEQERENMDDSEEPQHLSGETAAQ